MKKILWFHRGNPSPEERARALLLGAKFRNPDFVQAGDPLEICDGVTGDVPESYAEHCPVVDMMEHQAGAGEETPPPAQEEQEHDDEKDPSGESEHEEGHEADPGREETGQEEVGSGEYAEPPIKKAFSYDLDSISLNALRTLAHKHGIRLPSNVRTKNETVRFIREITGWA